VFALLVNPNNAYFERIIGDVQQAAQPKGVRVHILRASTQAEIDGAFASLVQVQAGALIVSSDVFFTGLREQLAARAARYAVPAIYDWREYAAEGGLISYGASLTDTGRQAGVFVGKILNGATPAELPVQQPTKFELVINLKTAKALDLTVPASLLARADEVIE
jgi:putative ABC transport system substrate-binding protein